MLSAIWHTACRYVGLYVSGEVSLVLPPITFPQHHVLCFICVCSSFSAPFACHLLPTSHISCFTLNEECYSLSLSSAFPFPPPLPSTSSFLPSFPLLSTPFTSFPSSPLRSHSLLSLPLYSPSLLFPSSLLPSLPTPSSPLSFFPLDCV